MNAIIKRTFVLAALIAACGARAAETAATVPPQITVTPKAIPGGSNSEPGQPTGGYAPSNVQAQLKIEVKEGSKEV